MIPLRHGEPLGRQLVERLRDAIAHGAVRAGERLPSSRELAARLGVSRNVIVAAYEQLLAEGYLVVRHGSGTYVAQIFEEARAARSSEPLRLSEYGARAEAIGDSVDFPSRRGRHFRYDFAYGRGDVTDFPFERWQRVLSKQARKTSIRDLDYSSAAGDENLRSTIAAHVRRSRGVICDSSQVIIVSGSQQALDLIARVLVDPGDAVAIENPHYQGARAVLIAAGAKLVPVPVDADGLDTEQLPDKARILHVTPSHQFPTGAVLSQSRRLAILDWARRAQAVVVEDDYDGEFAYGGHLLESLQGLDRSGRVIYVGTFSRTMFAALRIGYLIVPASLTQAFVTAKWLADRHTPSLEQRALAEFIRDGTYGLYLRRLWRNLDARRKALLTAIAGGWRGSMQLSGAAAGAHIVLWPGPGFDEAAGIRAAAERDVGVYGVSRYFIGAPQPGLLLGYSQLAIQEIRDGVHRLAEVIRPS